MGLASLERVRELRRLLNPLVDALGRQFELPRRGPDPGLGVHAHLVGPLRPGLTQAQACETRKEERDGDEKRQYPRERTHLRYIVRSAEHVESWQAAWDPWDRRGVEGPCVYCGAPGQG